MNATESTGIPADAYAALDRYAEQTLQGMDRSEIIPQMPSQLVRRGIYLMSGAIVVTLALLYFGQVRVVVTAKGRIVPEGDVIAIQALQPGVVHTILARAGDHLSAGAPIVKLDVQESNMDLAALKRSAELQRMQHAAVRASLAQIELILSNPTAPLATAAGGTAVAAIANMENALLRLETARQELQRLPERRDLQVREIELTRENIRLNERNHVAQQRFLEGEEKALAAKLAQLTNYRDLARKDLLSQLELSGEEERYRNAESTLVSARQRFEQQAIDISNQKLRLSELEAKHLTMQSEAQSNLRAADMAYRQSLAALQQERQASRNRIPELEAESEATAAKIRLGESRLSLSTITMPVSGTIVELKVNNPGELVGLGSVIASVAPAGVPLAIEASVPNKDIGFVRPGLDARVKVDAYPYQQFGTAPARVDRVLPGLGADSNFRVRLRLVQDRVGAPDSALLLFPGLTVVAEIQTTRQRLIRLLFSKESGGGGKP